MSSFRETTKCGLLLTILFASVASIPARAQAPAQPAWLDVRILQVKGGMALDFEDRVKELQAARKAAGQPPVLVMQVVRGHPNEYHMVTQSQTLAAANSEQVPMGPGAMAAWLGRITSTVDSVRFFYAITYPQHGIQAPQGAPPAQLGLIRTTRVISGKEAEYENWVANQYMPAFRQTNPLGHTMSRGVFGDNVSNFYHVVPIANWAAFDAGDPVEKLLGQRRMDQMINALDGIVESSELIVVRARPDLMGGQN
jgi:surface antigen